jgi:hypothetical protein
MEWKNCAAQKIHTRNNAATQLELLGGIPTSGSRFNAVIYAYAPSSILLEDRFRKICNRRVLRTNRLQNFARPLFGLPPAFDLCDAAAATTSLIGFVLGLDGRIDRKLEYLSYTFLLFCRALDIDCSHSVCNCLALFWRHGRKTLRAEELDACSFVAKVRL